MGCYGDSCLLWPAMGNMGAMGHFGPAMGHFGLAMSPLWGTLGCYELLWATMNSDFIYILNMIGYFP